MVISCSSRTYLEWRVFWVHRQIHHHKQSLYNRKTLLHLSWSHFSTQILSCIPLEWRFLLPIAWIEILWKAHCLSKCFRLSLLLNICSLYFCYCLFAPRRFPQTYPSHSNLQMKTSSGKWHQRLGLQILYKEVLWWMLCPCVLKADEKENLL